MVDEDFIRSPGPALEPDDAAEWFGVFAAPAPAPIPSNPRFATPENDPRLHPASPGNLVESFGGLVDELRQIAVDLGVRPYRVFSVVYAWSGGEDGVGTLSLVSEREFLPTPVIRWEALRRDMTAAGEHELGMARLEELSPRYTEDDLMGLSPTAPLPRGHFAFIEARMDTRDGTRVTRRRFTVREVPFRRAEQFDWVMLLQAQQAPRTREGEMVQPRLYPERLRGEHG